MTTITDLRVLDIRFPTSQSLDGSDAMNPDPDYSAAYVILETDRATALAGPRPDVHHRPRQRNLRRRRSRRWPRSSSGWSWRRSPPTWALLAPRHRRQPVALDRPGQGRDPSRHRRRRQCGRGICGPRSAGKPVWQTGGRHVAGGTGAVHRFPLHHRLPSRRTKRWPC